MTQVAFFCQGIVGTGYVPLVIPMNYLKKTGVVVCDQIRAIDKTRLENFVDTLCPNDLQNLEEGLRQVLSL